jgi:hypothetical protein
MFLGPPICVAYFIRRSAESLELKYTLGPLSIRNGLKSIMVRATQTNPLAYKKNTSPKNILEVGS